MSFLVKPIAKRLFKKQFKAWQDKQAEGDEGEILDLKWKMVPEFDRNGMPTGKKRKVKRTPPQGISEKDRRIVEKVQDRARNLDEKFKICGMKVGMSSVIGLVPVAGDLVDAFMAFFVMANCARIEGGLGWWLTIKMIANIGFDWLFGNIPLLGDLFDAFWKANTKNYNMLVKELAKRVKDQGGVPWPDANAPQQPAGRAKITTQPALTAMNHPSNIQTTNLGQSSRYENAYEDRQYSSHDEPTRPEPARVSNKTGGGRGWLGRLMDPQRERDVELGGRVEQPSGPRRFINGEDLRRAKEATAR